MKASTFKRGLTALFCFLCIAVSAVCLWPVKVCEAAAATTAKGAILMEVGSGRVLYGHDERVKMPMASCTKIMTALIAIESGDLDRLVTVKPEACNVEGSSIYLRAGEKLTIRELLYGLMLQSGNDCAVELAYEIGGDLNGFAALMNQKAKELGANDTNFVTPNGLHDDNHYTTALDLGLITCAAMKNAEFREIVSTKSVKISNDGFDYQRLILNKNKLLKNYEGADGVKTGYTKKAGRCLVGSATRNGMSLVCVVLNCGPMFEETENLLDYGFENFTYKRLVPKNKTFARVKQGKKDIVYTCNEGFGFPLKSDGSEDALIDTKVDFDKRKLEISFDNELIFSSSIGIININD